jgi:HPt (histidine-containing phosphotransfer) domain-containing protein
LRDGPRWLGELRAAIARGDRAAVEHAAHAIRGSASNLGGGAAAAVAQHVEVEARAGTLPVDDRVCAELEVELTRLQGALVALADASAEPDAAAAGIASA